MRGGAAAPAPACSFVCARTLPSPPSLLSPAPPHTPNHHQPPRLPGERPDHGRRRLAPGQGFGLAGRQEGEGRGQREREGRARKDTHCEQGGGGALSLAAHPHTHTHPTHTSHSPAPTSGPSSAPRAAAAQVRRGEGERGEGERSTPPIRFVFFLRRRAPPRPCAQPASRPDPGTARMDRGPHPLAAGWLGGGESWATSPAPSALLPRRRAHTQGSAARTAPVLSPLPSPPLLSQTRRRAQDLPSLCWRRR